MIINYGNSIIAKNIENVILFGKNSMKIVILNIILIVFILMVLNILYEIFLILVENTPSKVISKLVNELIFFGFLFFILIMASLSSKISLWKYFNCFINP